MENMYQSISKCQSNVRFYIHVEDTRIIETKRKDLNCENYMPVLRHAQSWI